MKESLAENQPHYTLRTVIDTVQQCNLRCKYCHPGNTWTNLHLPANLIEDSFDVIEKRGILEVVLTGGEITLHPELTRIIEATQILDKSVATLITNGTILTPELVKQLSRSNIARICTSIDGPTEETHNFGRGKTFDKAMNGLRMLSETGKPITVISVAHHQNYKNIIELSYLLAREGLASQHHICAPSYSGEAKKNYEQFRLRKDEYFALQSVIDDSFDDLNDQGLFVTFNSFWPATGERAKTNNSRVLTLQQLAEQLKNSYIILRPNGDVRLTAASWGRETIGNAVVGNLYKDGAQKSFELAEETYSKGWVSQLPREVEALHKFQYGLDANTVTTDHVIYNNQETKYMVQMIPIKPLSQSDLFKIELTEAEILQIASSINKNPVRYRMINFGNDSYILYDRTASRIVLLKPGEFNVINKLISKNV